MLKYLNTFTKKNKAIKNKNLNKEVFVGLSGGVDSSVSALLLKKAGYNVTGVFIKVWQPENGDCTWKEDRRDAMRVAAYLGIKFKTLNLQNEYKKNVVDYMVDEYSKGRTPNPDVMCNKEVKFGAFMNWALQNGAEFVSTGHYAQIKNGEMFEGRDIGKDQSYFLWTLNSDQLKKILFPVGHLNKSEVRKIAEENKIPVALKKDSQGVCFIGHIDMKDFIREHVSTMSDINSAPASGIVGHKKILGLTEGDVLDINGDIIGKHDGSLLYTIGERHGLVLNNNSTTTPRFYVIDKNITKNTITVAEKEQIKNEGVGTIEKIIFDDIHFISPSYMEILKQTSINCLARARYRQKKEKCILSLKNCRYEVTFAKPQDGITPGQSLVLYFDNDTLGDASSHGEVCIKNSAKTLGGVII